MNKRLSSVSLMLATFVVVSAFAAEKQPTWTILLYGHGDHNLSGSLVNDLRKIEEVGSSDAFRIVGQVDFDASRTEDNDEAGLPKELQRGVSRILFAKSSDPEHVTSKPVQRFVELNMDDPRVLRDFLEWGFKTYPAVRAAFAAFAQRLAAEVSPSNLLLFRTRRLATEYCIPSGNEQHLPAEYVDLGSLAHAFTSDGKTSPVLREQASRLGQAIDALVVAKAVGADKPAAKGLSVWYPLLPAYEDCEDEEDEGDGEGEDEEDEEGEEEDDEGGEEEEKPVDVAAVKEDLLERFQRYRKLPLFAHSPWPQYLEKVMKASENLPEDELEVKPAFRSKKLSARESLRLPVTVKESPTAFLLHGTLFSKQGKNTFLSYGEVVTKPLTGTGRVTVDWKPSLIHAVGRDGKSVPLAFYPVDAAGEFLTAWAKVRPPRATVRPPKSR